MALKHFQTPGSTERAEWSALSADPLWETAGGRWFKAVETGHYVLLLDIIPIDEADGDPIRGQVRWIDLNRVTLPEKRAWSVENVGVNVAISVLVRSGFGHSIASLGGTNPKTVRFELKRQVDNYVLDDRKLPEVPRLHHRRWSVLRDRDPVTYAAGFMVGMRRGDLRDASGSGSGSASRDTANVHRDAVLMAGWEHGWEFAVGRAPLPEWFTSKREASGE